MPNAKILIVEHENCAAQDWQNRLERLGYPILAIAPDGEQACGLASTLGPDLALLDLSLPGQMDSARTAAHLYQQLHIPVLYLAAHAEAPPRPTSRLPSRTMCFSQRSATENCAPPSN